MASSADPDELVASTDAHHPANLIPSLCSKFWSLGWVTGTGGGCSIRQGDLVYIAPSGVQKELMKNTDIYVLSLSAQLPSTHQRTYLRSPPDLKPSQCTPLFLAAFTRRRAGCCIHTHSQWAVLVTLLLEAQGSHVFEINNIEQIKAFPRTASSETDGTPSNLGFHDTLRIPVIENTPHEEDLTSFLEDAMDHHPHTCAVLVRRHGVYVWGDDVRKAKTQAESLDYLFQLAVEMKKLGIPWVSQIARVGPDRR
ncbi:methylthioribulose-1-phosphate dehydratase [Ophiocordyceps camponoti-floridani]|uniref:Methylthioribulose-1-phosphate dehydratase n=1 Tax=Ophiocordyceps camponoti-floridani TaxID=2030778 RepID=A0A8H4VGE1_9HYPO|nr:methylthioribulose-1-phosphate dehydratase [Ophiocordyceps camponoti-floridani]